MPWSLLLRLGAVALLGRFLVGLLLRCLFWVAVVVAGYLLLAPASRSHAQEEGRVVWVEPLAPALEGEPGPSPRGVVLDTRRRLQLPASLPDGARLWLAASADGQRPLRCDDLLRVHFLGTDGRSFTLEHDFRRTDGQGVEPWGPVELTGLLPVGEVLAWVEVVDLRPPLYGATPLFLVVVAPAGPTAGAELPAPTPGAAPPMPTAGATPPMPLLPVASVAPPATPTPIVAGAAEVRPTAAPSPTVALPAGTPDTSSEAAETAGAGAALRDGWALLLGAGLALALLLAGHTGRAWVAERLWARVEATLERDGP